MLSNLQAGVSSDAVDAMRANVRRWLEQCSRLGGDADLIGLALVRLSVKLALTSELCSMEHRLVNTLWMQPLAQPAALPQPPQPAAMQRLAQPPHEPLRNRIRLGVQRVALQWGTLDAQMQ